MPTYVTTFNDSILIAYINLTNKLIITSMTYIYIYINQHI